MNWQSICENPLLNDLPFKVETNKWGKIELSPASKELYFARGALEFWICDSDGEIKFFNNHEELTESRLVIHFPKKIVIDFA